MFRSGTTLLGRLIHAHPQVGVASDPFRPFYNSLRSQVAADLGQTVSPVAPLSDYYFDLDGIRLFEAIQEATLDHPLEADDLEKLRKRCASHGKPFAPRIAKAIDDLEGDTYREVFDSMVALAAEHYGPSDAEAVGFKEVWSDEFVPALCRSRSDIRCIEIVRDPRAVAASKNVKDAKYPWLFLARQWRKLAALSWRQSRAGLDPDRVLTLRFEDLVRNPEDTIAQICKFLDVDYAEDMADPSTYVDGTGEPWRQNTNFGEGTERFDRSAVDRWQDVLTDEQVAFIEALCAPEMRLHGYELETQPAPPDPLNPPRIDDTNQAGWMKGVVPNDPLTTSAETAKETLRYELLARGDMPSDVVRGCFLHPGILDAARDAMAEVNG